MQSLLIVLAIFGLMALASKDIGRLFARVGLPLISGFLLVGILTGPYFLGVFDEHSRTLLHFIDAFALAFIALAAGSELHLGELRGHWRSLISIIAGQTVIVYVLGITAFILVAGALPFMRDMSAKRSCGRGGTRRYDHGRPVASVCLRHYQGIAGARALHTPGAGCNSTKRRCGDRLLRCRRFGCRRPARRYGHRSGLPGDRGA